MDDRDKENLFFLFGFEDVKLSLDYNNLELKYVLKQSENFSNPEIQEKINFAYEVLKNPLKRIDYFFHLKNFTPNQEADKNFLMNFFELNEEIENLDDESLKQGKYREFLSEMEEILREIEFLFEENEQKNGKKISDLYIRAKYINRILENHFNYK